MRRLDVVAQAVSWFRAEQTGYWQQGDVATGPLEPDLRRMAALVATIEEHERGWEGWFGRQNVVPRRVVYEELVADPDRVVRGIADAVGITLPAGWEPESSHRRQADATNEDWAAALRAALAR